MVLIALLVPAIAAAQEEDEESGPTIDAPFAAPGLTSGGFGVAGFDFEELNAALNRGGFPSLDETFLGYSIGGVLQFGPLRLSSRGQLLFPRDDETGNLESRLGGGLGYLDLGYAIPLGTRTRVTPEIGVGGAVFNLRVSDTSGNPDFDEVIDSPRRSSSLRGQGFFASAGGGIDHAISVMNRVVILGARAGYRCGGCAMRCS